MSPPVLFAPLMDCFAGELPAERHVGLPARFGAGDVLILGFEVVGVGNDNRPMTPNTTRFLCHVVLLSMSRDAVRSDDSVFCYYYTPFIKDLHFYPHRGAMQSTP